MGSQAVSRVGSLQVVRTIKAYRCPPVPEGSAEAVAVCFHPAGFKAVSVLWLQASGSPEMGHVWYFP